MQWSEIQETCSGITLSKTNVNCVYISNVGQKLLIKNQQKNVCILLVFLSNLY